VRVNICRESLKGVDGRESVKMRQVIFPLIKTVTQFLRYENSLKVNINLLE